jgi:diacylglycerol kinase (ATP)
MTPPLPPADEPDAASPFKSRNGLQRIVRAASYSLGGLRAAWRHEAAFRQELLLGVPMAVLAPWIAPSRWAALAMIASIVLVWIVELLNSAIEALADEVTTEHRPLIGRAKDLGSASVMLCLLLVAATWAVALWP